MSRTENFVGRWSRLKRDTETRSKVEPPVAIEVPENVEGGQCALIHAQPVGDVDAEFDPTSLPSIGSIEIDTDIRGFLQPRVPPELTRAALRRAWASDPAIRDFIGIAENQWDFNDPTSIFGFGPMRAMDNVPSLLAQALGKLEGVAEKMTATVDPSAPAKLDDGADARSDLPVTQAASQERPVAALDDPVAVVDETSRRALQHGGALPR